VADDAAALDALETVGRLAVVADPD